MSLKSSYQWQSSIARMPLPHTLLRLDRKKFFSRITCLPDTLLAIVESCVGEYTARSYRLAELKADGQVSAS